MEALPHEGIGNICVNGVADVCGMKKQIEKQNSHSHIDSSANNVSLLLSSEEAAKSQNTHKPVVVLEYENPNNHQNVIEFDSGSGAQICLLSYPCATELQPMKQELGNNPSTSFIQPGLPVNKPIFSVENTQLSPARSKSTDLTAQSDNREKGDSRYPTLILSTKICEEPAQSLMTQFRTSPRVDFPFTTPPTDEDKKEICFPLALDEDQNWLSEFQCFVRSNLVEIYLASPQDVQDRKGKNIVLHQVGIRCQHCAKLSDEDRLRRSSCFPSKISRIYQSVYMMIHDHFDVCHAIPESAKKKFLDLKKQRKYGDLTSKKYWEYSAARLGMVDSEAERGDVQHIYMNGRTINAARRIPPYGTHSTMGCVFASFPPRMVVKSEDRSTISDFVFYVMSQFQIIYLLPSERIGNRKTLPVGMPGLGCYYCCRVGRLGFCRIFPTSPRSIAMKWNHFYDHIKRCTCIKREVKEFLVSLYCSWDRNFSTAEIHFFSTVWGRLGHE